MSDKFEQIDHFPNWVSSKIVLEMWIKSITDFKVSATGSSITISLGSIYDIHYIIPEEDRDTFYRIYDETVREYLKDSNVFEIVMYRVVVRESTLSFIKNLLEDHNNRRRSLGMSDIKEELRKSFGLSRPMNIKIISTSTWND